MKKWINSRYGTYRGLIRMLLAHAELATGRLQAFALRRPETVQRIVFVCHGNICRSAFAHHEALKYGLNATSLGLSTSTGGRSPAPAVASAARAGVDLAIHRATSWPDFKVQAGDLFLVMEVRQAHEMRRRLGPRDDVQVCLLGMWSTPRMPHLHDPYTLDDSYFDACFERVRQAVHNLNAVLPSARVSPIAETHLTRSV